MKTFELLPTEENLIETLQKDLLKRNKDLVRFYEFLLEQESSCSIAIDGRWGSGKTFFVKQAEMLINAKNPMRDIEEEDRDNIIGSLTFSKEEDLEENYSLAVYYDAWENDNDTDPILSLVYEIVKQIGIKYVFSNDSNLFSLAASILEALTGRNIAGIIENLKSETPLSTIKAERDLKKDIKDFFSEVIVERGNRLVIFIDELDRCKPSYAVRLLERMKHYLCDERITFVFSTNLSELQHTIKRYYGSDFDACRYLDRFFDVRISLPPADKSAFYREMGLESTYILETVCRKVIDTFNLELREIASFYRQVKTAAYEPTHASKKWDFSFPDGKARHFLLTYVVPIVVGLKLTNITLYDEFLFGKNSKPFFDIYLNSSIGERMVEKSLNRDECLVAEEGKILVTAEQKLQQLYDAIFAKEYTDMEYHTLIGQYEFTRKSKDFVRRVEGMLSDYADYKI